MEIVNVVLIGEFNQELNLQELDDRLPESEYNPDENPWLKSRLGENDRYVAFYKSGKCMITGCTSEQECEEILELVTQKLSGISDVVLVDMEVANRVGVSHLEFDTRIEQLAVSIGLERVEYEPEQFSGLIYKSSGCSVLVFDSGKVTLTGFVEERVAEETLEDLRQRIRELDE